MINGKFSTDHPAYQRAGVLPVLLNHNLTHRSMAHLEAEGFAEFLLRSVDRSSLCLDLEQLVQPDQCDEHVEKQD